MFDRIADRSTLKDGDITNAMMARIAVAQVTHSSTADIHIYNIAYKGNEIVSVLFSMSGWLYTLFFKADKESGIKTHEYICTGMAVQNFLMDYIV